MPVGLAGEGDYELKPTDRPIVFRSFIEGVGTHAIGVGFPGGLNAAFDAKSCRWTLVWKGRFLDAFSNFQDRPMKPITPLGTDVKILPAETVARYAAGGAERGAAVTAINEALGRLGMLAPVREAH